MSYATHKKSVERRARRLYEQQEKAIEVILEHPEKSRREQADIMGVSPVVFGNIIKSETFEVVRQERVAQLVDPLLKANLESSLLKTAQKAVDVVSSKLDLEPRFSEALETVKVTTQALGMQATRQQVNIQNNIGITDVLSRVNQLRDRSTSSSDPEMA